jgi:hypothetical protein
MRSQQHAASFQQEQRERRRRRKPGGFLHLSFFILDNLSFSFRYIATGWPLAYLLLAEPTVRGIIYHSAREGAYTSWREPGWSVSSLRSFALEIGLGGDTYCLMVFVFLTGLCYEEGRGEEMDYEGHDLTLALHGRFSGGGGVRFLV